MNQSKMNQFDLLRQEAEAIIAKYERRQAAVLPVLQLAQKRLGFISMESEEWVANLLGVSPACVHEVVTFYTMFRRQPTGRYHIQVCANMPCMLRGSERCLARLSQQLGIAPGQTTTDDRFTLSTVECLCACETAPMMQVNETYAGPITPALIDELISDPEHLRRPSVVFHGAPGLVEPVLSKRFALKDSHTIETYIRDDGYKTARKVVTQMRPDQVIAEVTKSNLRGLGGAGFPTGKKWGFLPTDASQPRFLVVNADEGEPGTFKDRYIIERDPHRLLEGMIIAAYAVGAQKAYVYVRGEYVHPSRVLQQAVDDAYRYGFLGKKVFNSNFDLDVVMHLGAGAYICGEETALLESLEGKKGFPRLRPPYPAVRGLYGCPTVINNVETLSFVPIILEKSGEWFARLGFGKSGGTRLFSVSGHVNRPGLYEASQGVTLRELIFDYAGGVPEGRRLKAVVPGGLSAKILRADEIDVRMDFDSLQAAGTMAGSAGVIVMDESACMVKALLYACKFFAHESCGQCSPCREGTGWIYKIVKRIADGQGRPQDLDNLLNIATNMEGRAICVFADAAAWPVQSYITKFREEFSAHVGKPGADPPRCSICWGGEYHVREGQCDLSSEVRSQMSEVR